MYGYVRPLKSELKVREYEQFKAMYCGLCHSLKARYGFAARFVVNYDFTYMAMLLSEGGKMQVCRRRCVASPFRKKNCVCADHALDTAADCSLILAYWKLKDAISDDSFFKSFGSRVAALFLRRAYRKAAAAAPEFDRCTREHLASLRKLEDEKSSSIDAVADCFAQILSGIAAQCGASEKQRILAQLFYHSGRIVYILDAIDDLPEDIASGAYNPLIYRYQLSGDKLSPEAISELELTLQLSENLMRSSFELLEAGQWSDILSNIIYEGFPWVIQLVLTGKWREMRKHRKEKLNGVEI